MAAAAGDIKQNLELKHICDQIESHSNFSQTVKSDEEMLKDQADNPWVCPYPDKPENLKEFATSENSKCYLYLSKTRTYTEGYGNYEGGAVIEKYVIQVSIAPKTNIISLYLYDSETNKWCLTSDHVLARVPGMKTTWLKLPDGTFILDDRQTKYKYLVLIAKENLKLDYAAHYLPFLPEKMVKVHYSGPESELFKSFIQQFMQRGYDYEIQYQEDYLLPFKQIPIKPLSQKLWEELSPEAIFQKYVFVFMLVYGKSSTEIEQMTLEQMLQHPGCAKIMDLTGRILANEMLRPSTASTVQPHPQIAIPTPYLVLYKSRSANNISAAAAPVATATAPPITADVATDDKSKAAISVKK